MNRKGPIMMALALLLGAGITPALPGVSIRSAAAADEPGASARVSAGTGLVRAVDAGTNTLVLEGYASPFRQAFADEAKPITSVNIGKAIGAYERTLLTPSPFDAYLR